MNVLTPMRWYTAWMNRVFFWASSKVPAFTAGLQTLSLIHFARWVIIRPREFPRLSSSQPQEEIAYCYMLFCSNFNGSWDQYVDSFSAAISGGLDKFWVRSIKYPKSIPMLPFHRYITSNQIWTDHYYNAYPMASSSDVKAGQRVRSALVSFVDSTRNLSPAEFQQKYNSLLLDLQHDLGQMGANPVISLAASAVEKRASEEKVTQGLQAPEPQEDQLISWRM